MPEISAGPAQSDLSVQSVEFEPIGSGKNVVHVSVSNPTTKQKVFLVHIRTDGRTEWERQYTVTANAREITRIRCAFSSVGDITKGSSIRLRFYQPVSAGRWDDSQYFQQQLFNLSDLQLRTAAELKSVPESDIRAVQARSEFRSFQQLVRKGQYRTIWDSVFSKDYQEAGFHSLDMFEEAMTGGSMSLFYWDRETLPALHPASVDSAGNLIVLSATNGKETWQIDLVPSEDGLRIDWISGHAPVVLQPLDQNGNLETLLAKTQTFNTQRFEIHYYKNSTAERELDSIAQTREKGYAKIVESLGLSGLSSDKKIKLFLFEDMKTKFLDTGSIGMGFAQGIVIGEVYNKKQRLDPYHETTHILMSPYGNPPAILSEGVAVYMSERLGTPALQYLGGGNQTLYVRVRDLKQKGEWISLQELLTYTDIGSQGSRTVVAYAEAGAFVKFLIETFGKDKFLEAYKKLSNAEDPNIHRQNQEELERIYGVPLQKLELDWERSFLSNSP